jgi:hypothetical protein
MEKNETIKVIIERNKNTRNPQQKLSGKLTFLHEKKALNRTDQKADKDVKICSTPITAKITKPAS